MNSVLKKTVPYFLLLLGLLLLLFVEKPVPAGVLFLLAIVMILESIWPEEWGAGNKGKLP